MLCTLITQAILALCLCSTATATINPDYQAFINISRPASFPTRDSHAMVILPSGTALITGGIDRVTQMIYDDVWVSPGNGKSGRWSRVTTTTTYIRRYDHGSVVVGSAILVFGGEFIYGAVPSCRHGTPSY
jgi:hypothetical protein